MDESRIQEIVDRVLARVGTLSESPVPSGHRRRDVDVPRGRRGVFPDVDSAVKAARRGHAQNEAAPLETRKRWIEAMRACARAHVDELARLAVQETGYGRVEDKQKKNRLAV